ncbi:hypothetical protein BCV72DRAFT_39498 [Rhizopus microsporus var. microsporus]|uniref:Uncharacterized protein n=2 Tax=Rhizopus microsporus TaxID=58291 RepID=A0A2G4SSY4_RHIZD|nr:uncharacterized protein RHIMIDRAFT_238537 [Rhizopus microsporus ATCC 52813]ORE10111.1 hypothetical protein BCV72DRAFT_39498 [Rhizopus microsporus var. microsporus]PHZ11879.1 hypothetical protein RHIMIDRAFT_238537 [Rhizopus microsporus ATCC 52813]
MPGNSKKRNRRLSNDAQWCLNNQTTLSLKPFAEHFGLLERQYTNARYKNIITKYIPGSNQLLNEYSSWNNSEECKLFWTARQRKKNKLNAKAAVVDYLGDVIRCETSRLTQANIPPIHVYSSDIIQAEGGDEGASGLDVTENKNHITSFNEDENLSRFEKSQNKNIYSLFSDYKEKAMQMSADKLLKIETHLHELLSHTNILLLTPHQHSETLLEVFSETTLNSLR